MRALVDGDVIMYLSIWGCESQEEALEKFDSIFTDVTEAVFSTKVLMAFGGPLNFRKDIYPDYKRSLSRVKSKSNRPDFFYSFKDALCQREDSIMCDGYEADDQVRMWAFECEANNIPSVVISVDKDLDCIVGTHFNPRTRKIYNVSEEEANFHYWKQILMGDPVDNIPGVEGIGKVYSHQILSDAKDKNIKFKLAVCYEYYKKYGSEGYEKLLFNGKLIHIWRWHGDHFYVKRECYDYAIRTLEDTEEV